MSAGNIKKLYILYILNVLKKYSDYEHRLTQKDIISHIRSDYGVECERKAIARNIGDLIDFGYDIEQDGGYYLAQREFEDSELRLLIDSVLIACTGCFSYRLLAIMSVPKIHPFAEAHA